MLYTRTLINRLKPWRGDVPKRKVQRDVPCPCVTTINRILPLLLAQLSTFAGAHEHASVAS